jgi:flagellar basal body-associated protein FliL
MLGFSVVSIIACAKRCFVQSRFAILCHLLALTAICACLFAGCAAKTTKSAAEMDASELLALFQERQHVDAKSFVEADLGRFRINHKLPSDEGQLFVQFHLFGVLPQERQTRLTELLPKYEKRVRDAVLSLVQRTETEHLCDPSLTFLKEEVAATVNRILQERLLIDVAFSDFSTDREAGMPWSVPAGEVKPPSGGGHGGGHGH